MNPATHALFGTLAVMSGVAGWVLSTSVAPPSEAVDSLLFLGHFDMLPWVFGVSVAFGLLAIAWGQYVGRHNRRAAARRRGDEGAGR